MVRVGVLIGVGVRVLIGVVILMAHEIVGCILVVHFLSRNVHGRVGVLGALHPLGRGKGHADAAVIENVSVQFLFGGDGAIELALREFNIAIALGFAIHFVG